VVLTERLYERVRPWIANHPSYAVRTGDLVCPTCGATPDQGYNRDGFRYTKTRAYQRYHCNRCGKWSRGRTYKIIGETTETNSW
jgi:transposase-like protein